MKRIVGLIIVSVFIGLIGANAQDMEDKVYKGKFQTFISRKDAVILTKSYKVDDCSCGVIVAWVEGEKEKVYAANLYTAMLSFEKLEAFRNQIDDLTQTIEKSYSDDSLSVNYSSSAYDFYVKYYIYTDSKNESQKNIYFKFGTTVFQSKTTEKLKKLSEDLKLAREKLVSLGAK